MNALTRCLVTAVLLAATAALVTPARGDAQERRRAASATTARPEGKPYRADAPFAGVWEGSWMMLNGPAANDPMSIFMTFDADKAAKRYLGFSTHGDGGQVPHRKTVVVGDTIRWEQPNSGGGTWKYEARLVSRDSISGTLTLEGARWGEVHKGKFTLARLPADKR